MIQPELALILDVLIAGLLVAVIIYAVRLNRSLSVLQKSKQELEQLLSGFSDSTEKAERAVQNVKDATSQNKDMIGGLLSEAEGLKEDLAFLIDRGNNVADRLDRGISEKRGPSPARDGDTASDIEDAMRAARVAADAPSKSAARRSRRPCRSSRRMAVSAPAAVCAGDRRDRGGDRWRRRQVEEEVGFVARAAGNAIDNVLLML